MLRLSTDIKKCSNCSCLLDNREMERGSLILTRWTDGKTNHSLANISGDIRHDFLVKCPQCLYLVWFNQLQPIESINSFTSVQDPLKHSTAFSIPKFDDYIDELKSGRINVENEQALRKVAWWAGNDARRDREVNIRMLGDEIENLHTLAAMIDVSIVHDRLTKVEIKRELGLFDEAEHLISESFQYKHLERNKLFIQTLIQKQDHHVQAYPFIKFE
ncbi:MAG TPA: hypothetical protein ENH74_09460 [Methylophaga sp.]|nr:hypothetical protein [Methylophaga sp.]HEC58918.1 hypothetical protein [Methylophaga sp.]